MSSTATATTIWSSPNYVGELFQVGSAKQTPFINMIGVDGGARIKRVTAPEFALGQTWDLDAASQASVSERASMTAATATTYARTQDLNTTQIFRGTVVISYDKMAATNYMASAATPMAGGPNPVADEQALQIEQHLLQIKRNMEYTFLNGSYQRGSSVTVASKTRGIVTACSTNSISGSSATLSKSLIDQLLRTMVGNGAPLIDPIVLVNAFQKQKISDIYAYVPQDRNYGGANIQQIETDFGILGVVFCPQMTTSVLLVADMSVCRPVFQIVPGKGGEVFFEPLAKNGAADRGHIYSRAGIDYGPEEYHGKLTSLATS